MTMRAIHLFLLTLLLSVATTNWADNSSVTQAKNKMKQLDNQITQLKNALAVAQDKRGLLSKELAITEKQMGNGARQLHMLQHNMSLTQGKIHTLQQNINDLNQQLGSQQDLLAQHIRTRYQMGEYQPIKWLLNQDDPSAISRLLTFYQYLVKSRQKTIDQISATKANLTRTQYDLNTELKQQSELEQQLHVHQQQFEQDKNYHQALIQSFNHEIQTKQHVLLEYEQNKKNLSLLLNTLVAERSLVQVKQPFSQMQHKLPLPVPVTRQSLKKMNQGLTLFAAEGTPVTAVYPGKVVFSDWLKGYGLLLIIDHGQGYMTLYAHNQSLYKQKGELVLQGEQIATIGHSGGLKQNGLYFEVRQRGKARSPLDWLS